MALPQGPNQRCSLDFRSDAYTDGRRFRIVAIVDPLARAREALSLWREDYNTATGDFRPMQRSRNAIRAQINPALHASLDERRGSGQMVRRSFGSNARSMNSGLLKSGSIRAQHIRQKPSS
jgi:hypothetical protein